MRMIVLFNLKPGVSTEDYEAWAKTRDIPGVRALPSIDDFRVYRTTGLLGAEGAAPYNYVEVLDVNDMEGLFADISTEMMQAVAAEFQAYAETPMFMLTEELSLA